MWVSLSLLIVIVVALMLALSFGLRLGQIPILWSWRGEVGRGVYAAAGIIGFALKHNIDRAVASLVFGRPFGVFNYWIPPVDALSPSTLSRADATFLMTLVTIALPFVWVGLTMTLRRLRSAGLPLWLVVLFFLPILNVVFFLVLCLIPESNRIRAARKATTLDSLIPEGLFASAAAATLLMGGIGALITYIGIAGSGVYGLALFVALPFCLGFGAVMIYSFHRPRTMGSCVLVSLAAVGLTALALLAIAVEGLICIVMAAPLATSLSVLGGIFGYLVQRGRLAAEMPSLMLLAVVFPAGMVGVEAVNPSSPEVFTVATTIRIEAPAAKVWQNLIAFPDLPETEYWLFKLGVSHPIRASIDGAGVGATRRCVFTTGTFVERIDGWEENRRLSFTVVSGAKPMVELSPYDIHPRHLDGYFVPERAEFTLTSNPDGSTTLEGRSWYRNAMWPGAYWKLWSDKILHDVHLGVFNHLKELSERV